MFESTLHGLRDVTGVRGTFVFGTSGEILARDVPSTVTATALESVVSRLRRMLPLLERLGVDSPAAPVEMAFQHARLLLVGRGSLRLAAIVGPEGSEGAARVAVRLAAERLPERLERRPTPSVDSPAALAAVTGSTPLSAPSAPGSRRAHSIQYRGRSYSLTDA